LSAIQDPRKQPTKHPACRVEAILALRSARCALVLVSRLYFLQFVSHLAQVAVCDILLEFLQLENTSDGTDIETKKHASETRRAGHGEGTPSIDLCRVGLDRVILYDSSDDLRTGADFVAHDCGSWGRSVLLF
jgi:hypothetical protein